jgi:ubiquinone/menaquinone biosynthesis C-methylase UbiE
MTRYPATIEHRWDILYRDYPEIYDAFSSFPYDPRWVDVVNRAFPLAGKIVVDTGSGTGKSSSALAEYAARVIGVEPEAAMRTVAEHALAERRLDNVEFLEGSV